MLLGFYAFHNFIYVYIYIYIYICSSPQLSRPAPQGALHILGCPSEWNMHAMRAYACIICTHMHE